MLDDDECLNCAAVQFIQRELIIPRADIYSFPLWHYILGIHDKNAYYWPEHHVRLFRRAAVKFETTVHAGMQFCSERIYQIPPDNGPCIHHLSHPDVSGWIARTDRYTSRPDRARAEHDEPDLAAFAHAQIDYWMARSDGRNGTDYPSAVALLRAIYSMVDRLKAWEESRGEDGAALFREMCKTLDVSYAELPPE